MADPTRVSYFYGRLTRDEAEKILVNRGCQDGLYLLRLCLTKPDDYAVAICFKDRVHHYSIKRQSDGTVRISGGDKFPGPVELVKHHRNSKDGMVEKTRIPCNRPEGVLPYVWPGVTINDLDVAVDRKHADLLQQGFPATSGSRQKMSILPIVAKEMHRHQLWFFGQLSRDEAERYLLLSSNHKDGTFLVRERRDGSLALSLLYRRTSWHYKIKVSMDEKFNIELGPQFDNIMDLITFYHNGGLLCCLTVPCQRNQTPATAVDFNLQFNPLYSSRANTTNRSRKTSLDTFVRRESRSLSGSNLRSLSESSNTGSSYLHTDAATRPTEFPTTSAVEYLDLLRSRDYSDDAYYAARTNATSLEQMDLIDINVAQLQLQDELGAGHFGSVRKASFRLRDNEYDVAVKMLKHEESSHVELVKEACLMSTLDNPYIIRLIGICRPRPDSFMLVVELAPIGSLKEYLKNNPDTAMPNIVQLLQQVARGMSYLEQHRVVHRDLAARNILLHTERHAKISDFGLSRDLGKLKDYYKSRNDDEAWPIKWYPPEVLENKKFASKSDVWSFGVTMWEATSYGETPYKGMDVNEYRKKIEEGYRLKRPPDCPCPLYRIMIVCWAQEKEARPSFREIVGQFDILPPI